MAKYYCIAEVSIRVTEAVYTPHRFEILRHFLLGKLVLFGPIMKLFLNY